MSVNRGVKRMLERERDSEEDEELGLDLDEEKGKDRGARWTADEDDERRATETHWDQTGRRGGRQTGDRYRNRQRTTNDASETEDDAGNKGEADEQKDLPLARHKDDGGQRAAHSTRRELQHIADEIQTLSLTT